VYKLLYFLCTMHVCHVPQAFLNYKACPQKFLLDSPMLYMHITSFIQSQLLTKKLYSYIPISHNYAPLNENFRREQFHWRIMMHIAIVYTYTCMHSCETESNFKRTFIMQLYSYTGFNTASVSFKSRSYTSGTHRKEDI